MWLFVFFCSANSTNALVTNVKPSADKAHHADNGFKNLYIEKHDRNVFTYLFMRIGTATPEQELMYAHVPQQAVDLQLIQHPNHFQATWVGHSTALIQVNGVNILTDPIFSERASPLIFAGPKRYTAPALLVRELPAIDYVVISHNHYDHLDLDSVKQLGNRPLWLVPLGLKAWFNDIGITNVIELDWWQQYRKDNIHITATPSQHWSARSLTDRFDTLWASWAIEVDDKKIWFAGDTGYNPIQFKEIGDHFKQFDLALIPIGSYAPRWFMKDMHVNPEEAVQIHQDIHSALSFGIHWGAFVLSTEPIAEPPMRLSASVSQTLTQSNPFITLKIGETLFVP